jgi:hypothetical protein
MARNIVVYGHADESEDHGFPKEANFKDFIAGGVFRENGGEYSYSRSLNADIILPERNPLRNSTLFFSIRNPLLGMGLASSRPFRWLLFGRNLILTRHCWVNNPERFVLTSGSSFSSQKKTTRQLTADAIREGV